MMNPKVVLLMDIFRSGLYLFIGVFLLFIKHPWLPNDTLRYAIAVIILMYGFFRVYITFRKINDNTAA